MMNNRISLINFLNNGGHIHIRLVHEVQSIFGINSFYICGSLESAKEVVHELYAVESMLRVKTNNFDINIDKFIMDASFTWNGIAYEPCFDYKQFCKAIRCGSGTYYLKAVSKVYGK